MIAKWWAERAPYPLWRWWERWAPYAMAWDNATQRRRRFWLTPLEYARMASRRAFRKRERPDVDPPRLTVHLEIER